MTGLPAFLVAVRLATWGITVLLALASGLPRFKPPAAGGALAIPLGLVVGFAVFTLLTGGRMSRPRFSPSRAPALTAVGVFLLARSAFEEVVWRGFVFGLLTRLGAATALGGSTIAFALSHWRPQRWRMAAHLVTGGAFASLYYSTGSLTGAIAAHGTYNVLIALSLAGEAGLRRDAHGSVAVARATNVTKRYDVTEAVRGVSLRLFNGELLGLLGPNGAGKTTLLGLLLGLRRPDAGTVRLFGLDPRSMVARASVGVTGQETGFPPTLRVSEVVDLVRAHFPNPVARDELLVRFDLAGIARQQAGGLSGGQRRRLAVALAFVGRPRALFLDEPTTGLDVESRQAVWREIREHVASGGAVLLTSHYLDEVEALATRVAVMRCGEVVAEGSVSEIRLRAGLTRVRVEAAALPALRGVERIRREGGSFLIYTADADGLVNQLVSSGTPFSGLEVVSASLEDAFLGLTGGS